MKKIILLAVMFVAVSMIFAGCGNNAQLEKSAVPVVTQILKEQLGPGSAECVTVKITGTITEKLYKAKAILNNGNTIKITIQDKGDQIYVTIPNEQ